MNRIRLMSVHFIIFLFFIAFNGVALKIDEVSSNIIPTFIESSVNNKLEEKSNRFRRENYNANIANEADGNLEDDIWSHIKRAGRNNREPKIWDQWSNWSTCSVTCGIGKIMRWRHCISGNCSLGEKKAQLKTCTSAAC